MSASVSIQPVAVPRGQPPSAAATDGYAGTFSALLSGLVQPEEGAGAQKTEAQKTESQKAGAKQPAQTAASGTMLQPEVSPGQGAMTEIAAAASEPVAGTAVPPPALPPSALPPPVTDLPGTDAPRESGPRSRLKAGKDDPETKPSVKHTPDDQAVPGIMLTAPVLAGPVSAGASPLEPSSAPGEAMTPAAHVMTSGAAPETASTGRAALTGQPSARADHAAFPAGPPGGQTPPEPFLRTSEMPPQPVFSPPRPEVSETAPVLRPEHSAPPPMAQIAPALVAVLKTADGAQQVTVRLDPVELGHVQIRIERAADGTAHVNISAERPETLQLLIRDEPRLREALHQAGLPADGGGMTFQVAAPEPVPAGASRSGGMADGARHDHAGAGGGQNGDPSRDRGAGPDSHHPDSPHPDSPHRQPRSRWFRAGLDITA